MYFERFYDEDLAQASFLVACGETKKALIIDPRRDYQVYLDRAREKGFEIIAVAETHIHADYLSGARELVKAVGGTLLVSAEGGKDWQYSGLGSFEHRRLQDGERFAIGEVHVDALHTPGHTPEHLCFALFEARAREPVLMITGDFLFVGTPGRPDLLETTGTNEPGVARESAHALYESLQRFRKQVSPDLPLWPGHGAGSACGKSIGALPCTTLGYELRNREWASFLENEDQEGFVEFILAEQPDTPTYFGRMKLWNRDGFPLRSILRRAPRLTGTYFPRALKEGAIALDLRSSRRFARGHLPGSLLATMGPHLAKRAAAILPDPAALVLITDETVDVDLAIDILLRVGQDEFVGFFPYQEVAASSEMETLRRYGPTQAQELYHEKKALLLDVRSSREFKNRSLEGARHLPIDSITENLENLPTDKPLITYCASGARASVAAAFLKARQFSDVSFVEGPL